MKQFVSHRLLTRRVAAILSLLLCLACGANRLAAETKRPARMYIENSIGIRLVPIEPGEFDMGSPDGEPGRHDTETRHRVTLGREFWMSVHEITQEQYRAIMENNPSAFSATGDFRDRVKDVDTSGFPVDSVSWHDAVEFCRRLSDLPAEKQAGRRYRLPTEAEWEYACRGGSRDMWHFGNEVAKLDEHAWNSHTAERRSHAVGEKKPNPLGLHDMYGNVWEWCSDWYDPAYYAKSPAVHPTGPEMGESKIIRGGGWISKPAACRSASRRHDPPTIGDPDTGFRVVMEIDSTKKESDN